MRDSIFKRYSKVREKEGSDREKREDLERLALEKGKLHFQWRLTIRYGTKTLRAIPAQE